MLYHPLAISLGHPVFVLVSNQIDKQKEGKNYPQNYHLSRALTSTGTPKRSNLMLLDRYRVTDL